VIWLSVAAVVIAATHVLFKPQRKHARPSARRRMQARAESAVVSNVSATLPTSAAARSFTGSANFSQFLHQLRFDASSVLKSIPFLVLLAFGVFNLIGGARLINRLFGTSIYPVTALMLESMQGSFQFLLVVVLA